MAYRGALIGCGFFAENHMHAWSQITGADVAAVCDLDAARAEDFAKRFGATPYTDAATMLAAETPDFVDVATTVDSHRPLVELAAAHAKLVICQKPFANTLADAEGMVAACASAGATLVVHENFRWQRPFRELRDMLVSGVIGQPVFLRLSFRHAYDIYTNQPYLKTVPDLALTDVGLHLFDVARFLLGDAESVYCQTQRLNPVVDGQDAFTALVRHTNQAVSSVECSFYSHTRPDPFPQTLVRLEGSDGTLELTEDYQLHVHTGRDSTAHRVEPPVPDWGARPWHAIQDSVLAFETHVVEVLDGKAAPQPSGAHNLDTLALTLAAIESSKTGSAVRLRGAGSTSA